MTAPMEIPAAFAPGAQVGAYRIVQLLGAGGMGAVFEAEHEALAKRVAIKTLRPELARDATARMRFLREGRAACRIRHPHVVEVFDVGELAGTPFLVMELLDGEDLAARLEREQRLAPERAVDVLLPVIAAVATAHEADVVHRDLKPENIFLARVRNGGEAVKVLDFGISRSTAEGDPRLTGTGAMPGTPMYLAPEQCRGQPADARSDQYALGVVLYECVTGAVPFDVPDLYALIVAVAEGSFPPPRTRVPALSEGLEAVILRAMAKAPAARFDDLRAFGRALVPFASAAVRAQWRAVFEAAPTPAVPPMALRTPRGGLTESLAGISRCILHAGFVRSPRGYLALAAALTVGLVIAALATPWRSARTTAERPAPTASPTSVRADASVAVVAAVDAAAPVARQVAIADAGTARLTVAVRAPVKTVRTTPARRDSGAQAAPVEREPAVPMCGGVPCP